MKIKIAAFVLLVSMASCSIRTCPTYSKNTTEPAKTEKVRS